MAAEWKGNVRQLKNVLESAIVMSRGDVLELNDFAPDSLLPSAEARAGSPAALTADPVFATIVKESDFRKAKLQFETSYLKAHLRANGGNITRTAAAIGLHRQSLQERLRELGIRRPGQELDEEDHEA